MAASAGEGNLLKKDSLHRAPTLLKLLGRRLGSIEGERLKSESSRSLAIFQQSLPLRFWGKGVWGGGGPFAKGPSPPRAMDSEEAGNAAVFAVEGNLLKKDSLPRAPTFLKLLGESWRE